MIDRVVNGGIEGLKGGNKGNIEGKRGSRGNIEG
jgi:hypothetical protein